MEKQKILFEDKIAQIKASFIDKGWVTIYQRYSTDEEQYFIYSCIVDKSKIQEYKNTRDWMIRPSSEGKPSIFTTYRGEKPTTKYQTYAEKGIEPFMFSRRFSYSDGTDRYIDISEEFVLYFNLYEKGSNKQNRKYYFIDEIGDLEEVIVIEENSIKIKLKFLLEYISIRKVYFSICFDFMVLFTDSLSSLNITEIDQDFITEKYNFNHLIRMLGFDAPKKQSWIIGKSLIPFVKSKSNSFHFDVDDNKNEKFIVGYDESGEEKLLSCTRNDSNYFMPTYFKKAVLDKYLNEPMKYQVDGFGVSSKFFSLKIDNNLSDYVAVFLPQLSSLPYKEQLHWKQYNVAPQKGISGTYYRTMIEGNWAEFPETPDLYFKYKYVEFNKKWEEKFGWKFYKPLSKEDEFRFNSLHIPTSNNIKAFCEQILSLSIITIDRLNEEEIKKHIGADKSKNLDEFKQKLSDNNIEIPENVVVQNKSERGLAKLERFLTQKGINLPDMNTFLRTLYDLRSGLLAHSFSDSNEKCKKAMLYFGIKDDNLNKVAEEIFIKSVYTMNTLERLLDKNDK